MKLVHNIKRGGKGRLKQGKFSPTNPSKYIGNLDNITYMSSWELHVMEYFDKNNNIIKWASEEITIGYISPKDGRPHKYYPDFYVKYKNIKKETVEEIWEVKPYAQTKQPTKTKKKKPDAFLKESVTFAINVAKWRSAKAFCDKYGWAFRIVTEKEIFK